MDAYQAVRSLSFPALASALGIDIQHFKRRRNGEFYGPCPIHNSKLNQTCFSFAADTGVYHCFSCNAKGRGGIDLAMAVKTVIFSKAVEILGSAPKEPAKTQTPAVKAPVASDGELNPYSGSYEKFKVACPWLEQRIPDAAVRERYGIFCYNNPARRSVYSDRVMLPVKDVTGTLFGYLGRSIEDREHQQDNSKELAPSKYLFPKNLPKSKFLFGAHELAQHQQAPDQAATRSGDRRLKVVYLVESPFCCLRFAMYGLPAVSPFGWSVSDEQVNLLATLARGIVYLPDRNKSAEVASILGKLANRLWLRFPPLPAGIDDPEQMTREQVLAL